MKPCIYCQAEIADAARKCRYCQSFQNPADAPKPSFDLATLVISFVGSIATVGTIAAGVFGFYGYRTVEGVRQSAETINRSSEATLNKAEAQLQTSRDEISRLGNLVKDLQQQAVQARGELNGAIVERYYDRFQQLADTIDLGYVYNFGDEIARLTEIANGAAAIDPISKESGLLVAEMKIISQAISKYKDALHYSDKIELEDAVQTAEKIPGEPLLKSRILVECYSKLVDISKNQGEQTAAKQFASKQMHNAARAYKIALQSNRAALNAKLSYATTLVQNGNEQEMDEGLKLLREGSKEANYLPGIWYDTAVYWMKKGKQDLALKNLLKAKDRGDFRSAADLHEWEQDPDFEALRNSQDPILKAGVAKLREIGQP
jgi:hypothetical protein